VSADPEPDELRAAVDELRAAAAAFDERLTEMMTVQRRLIRVVRRSTSGAWNSTSGVLTSTPSLPGYARSGFLTRPWSTSG
jgi:hypothetical protein